MKIIMMWLSPEEERNLRQEYDHLRQSIWNRGQTAWLVHSIIVSASLIAVLESWKYGEKFRQALPILGIPMGALFPATAIMGVLFSIYMQYTDLKLNDIMFQRMHEIEKQLGLSGPARMFEMVIKTKSWHKPRKFSWFILFVFLAFAYLWILILWVIT